MSSSANPHPELNSLSRSTTEPSFIVSSGRSDGSTIIRPELARAKSQIEKTADQSKCWSEENKHKAMASLLELEYQRATTDDERLSIIDECFTSGLISEGEKTKYTLRLVGLSSLGQGAGTKEEKISLIDQARREGFINDDKAEEDKRSLAE